MADYYVNGRPEWYAFRNEFYPEECIINVAFAKYEFSLKEQAIFIAFYLFGESHEFSLPTLVKISKDDKRSILKALNHIADNSKPTIAEMMRDDEIQIDDVFVNQEMLYQFETVILEKKLSWRAKGMMMQMLYNSKYYIKNECLLSSQDSVITPYFYKKRSRDNYWNSERAFDELLDLGYIKETNRPYYGYYQHMMSRYGDVAYTLGII